MNEPKVSLAIPGRNCAATIRQCLEAVVPMLKTTPLGEIIFVDDGSTDETAAIVAEYPVRYIVGAGRGPGSARNIGWLAAKHALVWFVDSDCVAERDALALLLPHMADPKVGGVSGSYGTMTDHSFLSCLIHEEIMERHLSMPARVNFLATFNVLYRRSVLEAVGGLDERYLKAQDAELSFRVMDAGHELAFERASRVRHFHPTQWRSYLRTQRQQGYWRVWLHLSHSGHTTGDSYSSFIDHIQPPLAVAAIGSSPLLIWPYVRWVPVGAAALLLVAQIPLTLRLLRRLRRIRYAGFALMSLIRAAWRGVGMMHGGIGFLLARRREKRA